MTDYALIDHLKAVCLDWCMVKTDIVPLSKALLNDQSSKVVPYAPKMHVIQSLASKNTNPEYARKSLLGLVHTYYIRLSAPLLHPLHCSNNNRSFPS